MKTIGRILVILLAACAISGATYALAQTGLIPTNIGREGGQGRRPAGSEFQNADPDQAFPEGQRPAAGSDRRGGGIAGLAVVLRNFVLMALVTAIGAVVVRIMQQRRWPARSIAH